MAILKNELGISAILVTMVGFGVMTFLCWTSVAIQTMLTRLADIFPLLTDIFIAAIIGGIVFAGVKGIIHLWDHALHIKNIYPDAGGAFPLVEAHKNYIDLVTPEVRLVQALSDAHLTHGKKPNATAIREAIIASRMPPMLETQPVPALPAHVTNGFDQFDLSWVNPLTDPHWLLIGRTGGGKSTAAYTIFTQLRQLYDAEFTICEPGGINWNKQADHIEYDDIAIAIEGEYEVLKERQAILRKHDVTHITDLPPAVIANQHINYKYLVLEEADSIFENLARDKAKNAEFWLRELARMGRKCGLGLFTLSQTALADVFNTHVRSNMGNIYLFSGFQQVAENYRVGKRVDLPSLNPGQAYNLKMNRTIQFPMATRPELRKGRSSAIKSATRPAISPLPPHNGVSAGAITLPSDPNNLTKMHKRHMLAAYRATGGYRPALRSLGLSEGGHWFYVLKNIVEASV